MLVGGAHYLEGTRVGGELTVAEALRTRREQPGFVWLSFVDPTPDELGEVAGALDLHELVVDDALSAHERPKFERHDGGYLVVLRTAFYDAELRRARFGELAVVLGDRYVVTARKGGTHAQGSARAKLEARPDLLANGVSAVLWTVLTKVVDDIHPVIEALDDDLIEVEAQVFSDNGDDPTRRIYDLRKDVTQLYRAVHPMLAPLEAIERGAYDRLEPMRPYLRDVTDDAKLLDEDVLSQRDRLTAVLEANLALVARRQNESVRKVSGWAAIIAVPTLFAGIYGMNFKDIPGLDWKLGFPAFLVLSFVVGGLLYWGLRRARWM
jgi:magnesium transporter